MTNANTLFRIAAVAGFLAVAFGAFGAHGLNPLLERNQMVEVWKTASSYHLIHAVVLLFVANRIPYSKLAAGLFIAGIVLFSGSLYLLALTRVHWIGIITPFGGVAFLGGWLALAFQKK